MDFRYTAEALLLLRESPLCVKPSNLPPAELWMGQTPDNTRNQNRPGTDRPKNNDSFGPLDPSNRRPVGERRHLSSSEDIVLTSTKSTFSSVATMRFAGGKFGGGGNDAEKPSDLRDRLGLRTPGVDQSDASNNEGGASLKTGNNVDRARDSRSQIFRRRGELETDSDGWSKVVKPPRKSFGHDGAERFQSRLAGDRRTRERDDSDANGRDWPRRTFDRDTDNNSGSNANTSNANINNDATRRNRLNTAGSSSRVPWYNNDGANGASDDRPDRGGGGDRGDREQDRLNRAVQRERIDRTKNWRQPDPESHQSGEGGYRDRNNDRGGGGGSGGYDRRWDRDRGGDSYNQRVEREPEWLDEEVGGSGSGSGAGAGGGFFGAEKSGGHTEEDFRRFMEEMKAKASGGTAPKQEVRQENGTRGKPQSAPAIAPGPDRFFEQFAKAGDDGGSGSGVGDAIKDGMKAKTAKSSRFTMFFSSQEDSKRQVETPIQPVPTQAPRQSPPSSGGGASGPPTSTTAQPDAAEKEAFQVLLMKLQRQTLGGSSASGAPTPSSGTASAAGMTVGTAGALGTTASNGTPPCAGAFQEPPATLAGTPLDSGSGRQRSNLASPESPYAGQPSSQSQRDEPRFHGGMAPPPGPPPPPMASQHMLQDILLQRQSALPNAVSQSPQSSSRPEQTIQELLALRQQAASQEAHASRMAAPPLATHPSAGGGTPSAMTTNAQTEFLMKLMQGRNGPIPSGPSGPGGPGPGVSGPGPGQRPGSDPRIRPEELLMRMPQPQKQVSIPSIADRGEGELGDFGREQRPGQQGPSRPQPQQQPQPQQPQQLQHPPQPQQLQPQQMQPQQQQAPPPPQQQQQMRPPLHGPPGLFVDDQQYHRQEVDSRLPPQPTQILQRPPPGLDHSMHGGPPPFLQANVGGRILQPQQQQQQQPQPQQQQQPQTQQQQHQQQQPMIPPPNILGAVNHHPVNGPPNRPMPPPNMPNMPGMNIPPPPNMGGPLLNMPPNLPPNLPPNMANLANLPPNMAAMGPMPMPPNLAMLGGMFPPNFGPPPPVAYAGPLPPDGLPGVGGPRSMHAPPPGFFGAPPAGFIPPPGMGFQGPPDGLPFPFDGRGPMPPPQPPSSVGYRRQ